MIIYYIERCSMKQLLTIALLVAIILVIPGCKSNEAVRNAIISIDIIDIIIGKISTISANANQQRGLRCGPSACCHYSLSVMSLLF